MTTKASASTNSATPSMPPWHDRSHLAAAAVAANLSKCGEQRLVEIRLHRLATRLNIGPKFASRISTITASTTGTTSPFDNREQLKEYDPVGYELVRTTFNLVAGKRLALYPGAQAAQRHSRRRRNSKSIRITPSSPGHGNFRSLAPTKVSDEALLKANDTIRKMFAYRHDILKALINDGAKLVVLGPGEHFPICQISKTNKTKPASIRSRYFDYKAEKKLLVVSEENVLGGPDDPYYGKSSVVRASPRLCSPPLPVASPIRNSTQSAANRSNTNNSWSGRAERRPIKRLDVDFDLSHSQTAGRRAGQGLVERHPRGPRPIPTIGPPAC